jgi:acyl carrier protein
MTTPRLAEAEILAWLDGYLAEIGFPHEGPFDLDAEFSDYGLDSVQVVILTAEFEDRFGIVTDPAFFLSAANLRNLFEKLRELAILAPVEA